MSYAMLPDELLDRLEEAGVSRDDRLLYVELHVYCARLLTDGRITARLSKITDHPDPDAGLGRLAETGLVTVDDTGITLPDFLRTNHARVTVEAMRAKSRQTSERHRRHTKGDHSLCDPSRCSALKRGDVTGDVTESVSDRVLSYPIRSDAKQRGSERERDDSAEAALTRVPASPPSETDLPSSAHVIADLDYTDYCAWCDLPRRNRHHQKVPAAIEEASRRLHLLGASRYAVTQAWDECWDTEATFEGWRLKVEHSSTGKPADAVMTFAEIVVPGVATAGIAYDVETTTALDSLVIGRIPGARPPSEYEFGDEGDLLAVSVYRDGDMTSLLPDVVALVPEIVRVIAARTEALA